jgi:hypothetical protein
MSKVNIVMKFTIIPWALQSEYAMSGKFSLYLLLQTNVQICEHNVDC